MATGSSFIIFAAIALMSGKLDNVQADCRSDIQNITSQLILPIQENSLEGTIIKVITTDYTNLHSTVPSDGFLTITNGSIVAKIDVFLDGPQKAATCTSSKQDNQPTLEFYCTGEPNSKKVVNSYINYTDDYAPSFTVFETNVNESAPIGFAVFDLTSIVRDDDCTNAFNFFIEGPPNELFQVRANKLELLQNLDYERNTTHVIDVTVSSSIQNGAASMSNKTALTVHVLDVDDMSPVFEVNQFLLRVPEEQDLSGTWLNTTPPILATDGDVGINTTLIYSITSITPNLNLEINNETGQVKLLDKLDRENIPAYIVVVKAAQADVSYRTATATLSILVDDVNDNRPVYTSESHATIMEDAPDGSYVMELTGEDRDEGDNSLFEFIITSDSTGAFKTNIPPGTNRTILVVDNSTALRGQVQAVVQFYLRERLPAVAPACSNTSTCIGSVTIDITDVNDNTPMFNSTTYNFTLPSNTSGHYDIGQVFATDADRGSNAVIKYSSTLVTGPPDCSLITLDATSGVLATDQQLPPGAKCSWIATACDSPTDPNARRCSFVPVSVTVILSGDVIELNVTVPENVPVGTVVTILSITGLHTTSTDFEIKDYSLVSRVAIDREAQDFYQVPVFAKQNTNSPVMIINVNITDVNDNTPVFTNSSYIFTMASNASSNSTVGQVEATDDDSEENADVVYSLTSFAGPVECSSLKLDPKTGGLWIDQPLTAGVICPLLVTACDSPTDIASRRCSSVPVSVTASLSGIVVERNVTILENVPVGTLVFTLPILGLNTTSTDFQVKDMSLVTNIDIDRERKDFYQVPVFSKQSTNSPIMIINVNVKDVNDNTPVFTNPSYIFTMASNASSNSTVGQVEATDEDSKENADVVYNFTSFAGPGECSGLKLDPKTGALWIDQPLTAGVVCSLIATACDSPTQASLRRCSSVPVSVTASLSGIVVERNVTILENVPVGTLVFTLPINGLQTTSPDFDIKDNSLVTKVDIDRELKDFYQVLIFPNQITNPPVMILNVHIADVNDNTPVFTNQNYIFTIASNISSNSTIGNVIATDLDIGDNSEIQYNLTSFSGPQECLGLALEPATGQLISNQPPVAGIVCSWIVTACDSPRVVSSRRCSSVPLTVSVIPSGNVLENSATLPENVPIGTMVKALPITGLHTTSTEFEIRNDVLYTKVLLDREREASYEVSILSGQNGNSVVMIIYVNISDVNDNAPVFGQSVYVINMDSSWKINQTLLQVNASDADTGTNARLAFSMATGKDYFDIDPTTGQIQLINFPTTRDSEYQLLVTDFGQPSLSSLASLKVYNPVHNETAVILLPVSKDVLMADRDGLARKLGLILGLSVKVYNIESLSPAPDVGSKVYISATSAQGQSISPTELNKLLETHAMEIYDAFAKPKQASEDSNDKALSVLEIVLICLASVLLLLLLLAAFLWYRSNRKLRQSRRLFDSLNKDTTIYDNPRKPSSSAAVIASSNNNSTNAQRMMARLSSGSVGNSSVTNLLPTQGDGGDPTPPGSNSSQRRQQSHQYENVLNAPLSNPVITDYENVLNSPLSNPVINDDDGMEDTLPVETNEEQITTFSSQIENENLTNTNHPHIATVGDESNQDGYIPAETWSGNNTTFSGRRNSDVDSGTISDKETQLEDADEDDQEVADILSETSSTPLSHSHGDTADSPANRSNLDLMTAPTQLEDAHPAGVDNPGYVDTENPNSNLPPEPEPDYAKKVRFSDATATMDTNETENSPDDNNKDMSLAKFLNQYGGAENLATYTDTTQNSYEEMTAL